MDSDAADRLGDFCGGDLFSVWLAPGQVALHLDAEMLRIVRASLVLAISLVVLDYILVAPNFYGTFFFGKITIALYLVIQILFLSATRVAYRHFREGEHSAAPARSTPLQR